MYSDSRTFSVMYQPDYGFVICMLCVCACLYVVVNTITGVTGDNLPFIKVSKMILSSFVTVWS